MQGASIKRPFLKQIDFCIFLSNLIKKKCVIFNLYNNAFFSHFLIAFFKFISRGHNGWNIAKI